MIAQYFPGETISSAMAPSAVDPDPAPATVYKDTVEALAATLAGRGALADLDPASSVICMMLPRGVVLSDAFSPGYRPPPANPGRSGHGAVTVADQDAVASRNGLGGYHGSVHLPDGSEIFYAAGVYSETAPQQLVNGIDAFGVPWKNVVATFYHELNESRTDAAIEDVNATGDNALLGWYSQAGQGEVGDLPINACNGNLALVFKEVARADGRAAPIQLMWSNADDGPASSTGAPGGRWPTRARSGRATGDLDEQRRRTGRPAVRRPGAVPGRDVVSGRQHRRHLLQLAVLHPA